MGKPRDDRGRVPPGDVEAAGAGQVGQVGQPGRKGGLGAPVQNVLAIAVVVVVPFIARAVIVIWPLVSEEAGVADGGGGFREGSLGEYVLGGGRERGRRDEKVAGMALLRESVTGLTRRKDRGMRPDTPKQLPLRPCHPSPP